MIKLAQMDLKGVNWVQNTNIFSIKSKDIPLNPHIKKKQDVYPLAPDSKLNVVSYTFNVKSVVFDQNPVFSRNLCFLSKSAVFDEFWNHEV